MFDLGGKKINRGRMEKREKEAFIDKEKVRIITEKVKFNRDI